MSQPILAGGCFCGAIRYPVEGTPAVSAVCHCRTRRKIASATPLPFLTVPAERFAFAAGTPIDFDSSEGVTRSFCGTCGSPLTYRNDKEPRLIDVMTCSLDDPETFPPTHYLWVSHKLNWETLADGLLAFDMTRTESRNDDDG